MIEIKLYSIKPFAGNIRNISGGEGGLKNGQNNTYSVTACITDTEEITTLHCWTKQSNVGTQHVGFWKRRPVVVAPFILQLQMYLLYTYMKTRL